MPRLVVTLTMRPHLRLHHARHDGLREQQGRGRVHRDEAAPVVGLTSQKRIGRCQLSARNVAWPIPALLTRMSTLPKRARVLTMMSTTAESRLRSASIVSSAASRPISRARRRLRRAGRHQVDRGHPQSEAQHARTSSWPMPPPAPVTIATRCPSLMPSPPIRCHGGMRVMRERAVAPQCRGAHAAQNIETAKDGADAAG